MVKDFKDLTKLLKLCRQHGVTEIKLLDVEFKLGAIPIEASASPEPDPTDPYANFPQGELTPEQLMFYSAGGIPENDPELTKKDSSQ